MRQAVRFLTVNLGHRQPDRTGYLRSLPVANKPLHRTFGVSASCLIDDYSKHPRDRLEPPHDPKFDRPLLEWWKQSEARRDIELPDDSWSNAFNVSIMPEEVRYPDAEHTATQKLLHNDVLQQINEQITRRTHNRLFAVVHVAGRQYKVCEDDLLSIRGTFHAEFGQKLFLQKVLCAGCSDFSLFGRPMLDRNLVRVHATVIEKTLSATQTYYYFLRKIGVRQWRYLRTAQTVLRINQIEFMRRLDEDRPINLMPQPAELTTTFASDAGQLTNFEMPDRPWFPLHKQKKRKVREVMTTGIPGVKGGKMPPVTEGTNRNARPWSQKPYE